MKTLMYCKIYLLVAVCYICICTIAHFLEIVGQNKIKKFAGCNGLSYKHNKGFSHFHPIPGKIESHWTCQSCQFPFSQQL